MPTLLALFSERLKACVFLPLFLSLPPLFLFSLFQSPSFFLLFFSFTFRSFFPFVLFLTARLLESQRGAFRGPVYTLFLPFPLFSFCFCRASPALKPRRDFSVRFTKTYPRLLNARVNVNNDNGLARLREEKRGGGERRRRERGEKRREKEK